MLTDLGVEEITIMYDNFGKFPKKYVILRSTNFSGIMSQIDFKTYIPNLADAITLNKELENNLEDNALQKLFTQLCPENTILEDVLIKCTTLNRLYSTNIFNIRAVAEHIHLLNIDERLHHGDLSLVESIAQATPKRRFYSFATKYCAMHQPGLYSIYDSNVHRVLRHYLRKEYSDQSLKNYETYCQALRDFKLKYHLEELDAWRLDKYLWRLGKLL